jgi:thioredoxin-related protein
MSKKELTVIIIILLGLNFWSLLGKFSASRDNVDNYKELHQSSISGDSLFLDYFENEILNNNFYPSQGLRLLVFFDEEGCYFCIEKEVELINSLQENYDQFLDVYYNGNNKSSLARIYKAEFDYSLLKFDEHLDEYGYNKFNNRDPFALLVDKNGALQVLHKAQKNDTALSVRFFAQMKSLFESISL